MSLNQLNESENDLNSFFRNNKKKTNKISWISYFFPTHCLVHRKVRCPPKVPPKPTSIHIIRKII